MGLLLLAALAAPGQAQENPEDVLNRAIALADEGEWEQSIGLLEDLLSNPKRLGVSKRMQARKYLGINHILLGSEEQAVTVFKDLVREDTAFTMDDLAVDGDTPDLEVVRFFGQALLEVRREELEARQAQLDLTSRRGALMRSALLPGWGQRYLGYRARSYTVMGLTAAAIAYAVVSETNFRRVRDDYRNASTGAEFDQLFEDYRTRADRADLALGAVAVVWGYNIIDALVAGPNLLRPSEKTLVLRRMGDGVQLSLIRNF